MAEEEKDEGYDLDEEDKEYKEGKTYGDPYCELNSW